MSGQKKNRYVIHLPIDAGDLTAATRLARTLRRSMDFLPGCDTGETTVTIEGDQATHHRVFCNRLIQPGRRCVLRAAASIALPHRAGPAADERFRRLIRIAGISRVSRSVGQVPQVGRRDDTFVLH